MSRAESIINKVPESDKPTDNTADGEQPAVTVEQETTVSPAETDHKNTPADSDTSSTRLWPVYSAVIVSLLWLSLCGWYAFNHAYNDFSLPELLAGVSTPLVLIWLVALVAQRTDPMLERRVDLSRNLHKAIAPVEIAEQRLENLTKKLKKELEGLNAVSDLASDRISNLENSFQEQISNLFAATADAEARSVSIRDVIERERSQIDALSIDLVDRVSLLEDKLDILIKSLTEARADTETSIQKAEESVRAGGDTLSRAGQDLENSMADWQGRLAKETSRVCETITHAETRVDTVSRQMQEAVASFTHQIGDMNTEADKIAAHLIEQADKLAAVANSSSEQAAHIEETLRVNQESLQKMTDETLAHSAGAVDVFTDRAENMNSKIRQSMSEAHTLLENVGKAQVALSNTTTTLSSYGDEVVAKAEETANRSLNHIRQLQAGIEDQLKELEAAGLRTGDQLRHLTEDLSGQGDKMLAQVGEASEKLQQAQEEFSTHGGSVSNCLMAARQELSRLEEDLLRQKEVLATASQDAASHILAASDMFKGEGFEISKAASDAVERLTSQAGMVTQTAASLSTEAALVEEKLKSTSSALGQEASTLKEELQATTGSLGRAAKDFADERKRIRDESESIVANLNGATNQMVDEINRFTESSMEASNRLDNASRALVDETQNARMNLETAIKETQENLENSVQGVSEKAGEHITFMQDELQATLARLLQEYQDTARNARDESDHLAKQMGINAERITAFSTDFQKKAEAIEKRLADSSKDEFARTSQLLMESLQSLSIDIHKGLSADIPDDVWERYMEGDRSIFLRRTMSLGDRKSKKAIKERYDTDPEFREVVARYLRDFQDMIERVMLADRGSTMSVTLLSSDVGKLYILLAQSLKKLS
ncbi:hypothetical protein GCM10017044_21480 [Kordiimonas sediminis]|uniref:ATPase n=1 Tax=Kordiimonas sediminis TaxID=1735581 RepID=A0A919AU77_9PROT|nr:hypothetical protein [Kordiimonas sediminis]GHF26268.1 hypothetical protein GCM10017044_21480 [Kordiimonas sediminis]